MRPIPITPTAPTKLSATLFLAARHPQETSWCVRRITSLCHHRLPTQKNERTFSTSPKPPVFFHSSPRTHCAVATNGRVGGAGEHGVAQARRGCLRPAGCCQTAWVEQLLSSTELSRQPFNRESGAACGVRQKSRCDGETQSQPTRNDRITRPGSRHCRSSSPGGQKGRPAQKHVQPKAHRCAFLPIAPPCPILHPCRAICTRSQGGV